MDELNKCLNEFLADLNVFYRKLQNYHWNVEGSEFFVLHEKLEEYYDCVSKEIDEIAEHILINKGQPLGTLKDYLAITKITEAENKKIGKDCIYKNILADYGILLNKAIDIKQAADNISDYGTSSLMDEYILDYGKKMWMLEQSK